MWFPPDHAAQPITCKPNRLPLPVPQIGAKHDALLLGLPAPAGQSVAPPQPDPIGRLDYNPMIVVDAMRFPYIEGGGTAGPVTQRHKRALLEPAVPAVPGRTCRSVTQ